MNAEPIREERRQWLNTAGIHDIMSEILRWQNDIETGLEYFWVVGLDHEDSLLFIELIDPESLEGESADPMDIFSFALQKKAKKILLVHNHPSGDPAPTDSEKDLTDHMIQVGKIVDTEVLDHLIITPKAYFSFADQGLIEELAESTKWEPPYKTAERLRRQAEEIGRERGRREGEREGRRQIAAELKKRGVERAIILETTGVPEEELDEL